MTRMTLLMQALRQITVTAIVLYGMGAEAAHEVLDTAGFEAYSPGQLQGQPAGSKTWLTIGSGGGAATVEATAGVGGTSGVRVDRGANSDDWWAVSYRGDGLPTQRFVFVDWDMRVNDSGAGEEAYGPFFGVTAYDDSLGPQLLGSLGVDATTRDVLYQEPGTGALIESGVTVDGGWHHFQVRLDYSTYQYAIAVDDTPATPLPIDFVDGAAGAFSDADIAALAAGSDVASQEQIATAFFDNFVIRQSLPGDYNFDGRVDAADYTVWRDSVSAPTLVADGDGDGDVDQDDFVIWSANYSGGAAAAGSSTPEPATLLLVFSVVGFGLRDRKRTACSRSVASQAFSEATSAGS